MNSRDGSVHFPGQGAYEFGKAGGWRHSYQWGINRSAPVVQNALPTQYVVFYPDGRYVTFQASGNSDPYFESTTPGVRERFIPMTTGNDSCYLLLADGGKVAFQGDFINPGEPQQEQGITQPYYDYSLVSITDPYGQVTSVGGTRDSRADFRPTIIREPAGRSLVITYTALDDPNDNSTKRISSVTEFVNDTTAGRTVSYTYGPYVNGSNGTVTALQSVTYFGDSTLTATYNYQPNNDTSPVSAPLVATCDDSMYGGAMSQIAYDFVAGGTYGFLLREKYIDGTPVSTLSVSGSTRTETRGDSTSTNSISRTFTYQNGYLINWNDFKTGNERATMLQGYTNGFVSSFTDGRTHETDFQRDQWTGNLTRLTHPLTPPDIARNYISRSYLASCSDDPNNCDSSRPYYLYQAIDERQYTTTYKRDDHQRVANVSYPDNAAEEFVYNNFGEVTRHRRKNGYYEHLAYDGRGLLLIKWNPLMSDTAPSPTGSEPKTIISYYPVGHMWQDRVQDITDPRGNKVTYLYDLLSDGTPYAGRGLVSKIFQPPIGGAYAFQSFLYDRNGRKVHEENGLREPTEYVYDHYGRITQLKRPHPSANNAAVQDGWDITLYDNRGYDVADRLILDRQTLTTTSNAAVTTIQPTKVVSRKTHGSAGTFDIEMPLTGAPGIECRTSGQPSPFTLVLTFSAPPVSVAGARVTAGTGIAGSPTISGNDVTVNLNKVANAQILNVLVYGISDGTNTGQVTVPIKFLIGDVNQDGVVNGDDLSLVRAQQGNIPDSTNFREDINVSGRIDGGDAAVVQGVPQGSAFIPYYTAPDVNVTYKRDKDGRMTELFAPTAQTNIYDFTYTYDGMSRLETITEVTNPPSRKPYYVYQYDANSNVMERDNNVNTTSQYFGHDEINRITSRGIQANYLAMEGQFFDYPYSQENYSYDPMTGWSARTGL